MSPRNAAPINALVVDPQAESRTFAASTLAAAGFRVAVADSFETAQRLATTRVPSLVLADVRLGQYNGLHLILSVRFNHPHVAGVVTYDIADPALAAEANRSGVTFVPKPVGPQELLAAVFRTLWRQPGDPTPVTSPFERRAIAQRRLALPVPVDRRGSDRRRDLTPLMRETFVVM